MSGGKQSVDLRTWLQELKGNRRTQGMLLLLAGALAYLFWPESPRPKARRATPLAALAGGRQLQGLDKLPDLVKLDRAGQLPSGEKPDRMYRDLFTFDLPPGPPPPPPKPLPPPPPPTPEQIRARELQQARDAEAASRPQQLRYLGWFGNSSSGPLGAFVNGEEPVTLRLGAVLGGRWKLMSVTADHAEFQNLKFPDIRHNLRAEDRSGNASSRPTNDF